MGLRAVGNTGVSEI